MSVFVIVTFQVKQKNIFEFESLMSDVKVQLPKVDGCNAVLIYRHSDESNQFILIENWSNKKTHQLHLQYLSETGAWESIRLMLNCEPSSVYTEAF